MTVTVMSKTAFSVVKYVIGTAKERAMLRSALMSNVRRFCTARTVLAKDMDRAAGTLYH